MNIQKTKRQIERFPLKAHFLDLIVQSTQEIKKRTIFSKVWTKSKERRKNDLLREKTQMNNKSQKE